MSNIVYDNRVIASKATELLLTKINHRSLMTIDDTLQGAEGMLKTINTYTYSGNPEEVAAGAGCTAANRGSVSYVGNDYRVKVIQEAFDYLDEDVMKDSQIVDIGVKGATEKMTNFLTNKFYDALATKVGGVELVGATTFANNASLSYEAVVDAIADMVVEDESQLFLLIPVEWKAAIRKDEDYKSAMMGEVIYNGQIGTIAGIPVIASKAIKNMAYLMTREAVTLFVKKNVEVEPERDADTRSNSLYFRECYIAALTDATKARKIGKAQATAATITTSTAGAKTIAGAAATGAKVQAFVNGVASGSEVTATSSAYTITAAENLASGDKVTVVAKFAGCVDSVATVTVA